MAKWLLLFLLYCYSSLQQQSDARICIYERTPETPRTFWATFLPDILNVERMAGAGAEDI